MDAPNQDQGNRRSFTRVPMPFPVSFTCNGIHFDAADSIDVSAKGICLELLGPMPVGAEGDIAITLGEGYVIQAQGRVARAYDGGVGVEFTSIEVRSFELLKNLVRFNAPDPGQVEREFDEHLTWMKKPA